MRRVQIFSILVVLIAIVFIVALRIQKNEVQVEPNILQNIFSKKEAASFEAISFVSPHHLVAEKMMEKIFSQAAEKNRNSKVEQIILVSPNHFNLGRGWAVVSDADWLAENSVVKGDKELIGELGKSGLVHVENDAFQKEHGIENLVPLVAKYFPEAKLVPLIVRDGMPAEKIDGLAKFLSGKSGENSMLILSADFSHTLEKNISRLHDRQVIGMLKNLDFDDTEKLDVDCVPGLRLLMKFSASRGFEKFILMDNSNSSEIYGKNFIGENTSYVTGYFTKGKVSKFSEASFLFLGDLMLDRDTRTLIRRKNPDFITEKIQRLFWSQDYNIANLEGSITDSPTVSVGTTPEEKSHFAFTFDPQESGIFLKNNRINLVNIGNNHILNFKLEGLEETKNNLAANGVEYFGNPLEADNYWLKNIRGLKVALVSYNQFSGIGAETTANLIKNVKTKSDFVAVYAHWGTEYQLKENESQRKKAHMFVDAGADMVIGSHPHVVEPLEVYKNKIIFYSLGNFVFDQYFSEDTKTLLSVAVTLDQNGLEIALVPLYQNRNGQIELAPEQKRQTLLERLADDSTADDATKQEIRGGYIIRKYNE